MKYKEKYSNYYKNYLGIANSSDSLIKCEQREKPLTRIYFQDIIITKFQEKLFFSVSPLLFDEFQKKFEYRKFSNLSNNLEIQLQKHFLKKKDLLVRRFYRMIFPTNRNIGNSNARRIQISDKDFIFSIFKKELTAEKKKKMWESLIKKDRFFILIKNNSLCAQSNISDIIFTAGNIVVYTYPNFRNLGYGKEVVKKSVLWCKKNNILPIYWVDVKNIASVKLAENLGFVIMNEEIVVSHTGKSM